MKNMVQDKIQLELHAKILTTIRLEAGKSREEVKVHRKNSNMALIQKHKEKYENKIKADSKL